MTILKVALDVPIADLFDYFEGDFSVQVGQRVGVQFRGRRLTGIVMEKTATSTLAKSKIRAISTTYPEETPLSAEILRLLRFCAGYYHYPLGQAVMSMLPPGLRLDQPVNLPKRLHYRFNEIGKSAALLQLNGRAHVQQQLAACLQKVEGASTVQLGAISTGWRRVLKAWGDQGWLDILETEDAPPCPGGNPAPVPSLNAAQQAAVEQILHEDHQQFRVWLLHGVTGSGKTEVYMRLLDTLLLQGKRQALILVPEISLTPQLEARFKARFSNYTVVTLHSNVNSRGRLEGWLRCQRGQVHILVGTRLAVFTPMPNLGLIVVDEEHDLSFKQQEGMRYSARDVAVMRAKQLNIPVVLGSATPSLESWYNMQVKDYRLLTMPYRAVEQAQLPRVACIDSSRATLHEGVAAALISALQQRLERGEQSLLYINRRGFAPVLMCNACNWVSYCTRCTSRMVVHQQDRQLRCHHCGYSTTIEQQCPTCGNPDLFSVGYGTQRIVETIAKALPTARILRVDSDSMRSRQAIQHMTAQVRLHQVDILIGTQILTKGHDFPNLTLVGILDIDGALLSPDFRAAERLFAQLMQVAGRAGRAEKSGEVLIQTHFPEHPLFHALAQHDFVRYVETLLAERQSAHLAPYGHEALLRVEAPQYALVQAFVTLAADRARQGTPKVTVYDPVRPFVTKINRMEREQLLLQSGQRKTLQQFLERWIPEIRQLPLSAKVRWAVDVDPMEY